MFLVLKLCPIQVVISLPLWIKLTMGQLLLFFLCNFSTFFSYVGGIPVTNHFSLLLIDRYTLAIQQIIAHKEHLWYCFWYVAIFWTFRSLGTIVITTERFYWAVPSKSRHFLLFWCLLCTVTSDISSSSKNINSTTRVSRLSFRFLWLWCRCTQLNGSQLLRLAGKPYTTSNI